MAVSGCDVPNNIAKDSLLPVPHFMLSAFSGENPVMWVDYFYLKPLLQVPRKALLPYEPATPPCMRFRGQRGEGGYVRAAGTEGENECQNLLKHKPWSLADSVSNIHQT